MDQHELERELLELCDRVAGARARYKAYCDHEDVIRGVNTIRHPELRDAKENLADIVRVQALSEDQLWRALIEGTRDRILASFQTKLDDLHKAVLVESENNTREIEAVELLSHVLEALPREALQEALWEEIEDFMDPGADPSPRDTEGDLRFHDPEGKA